MANRSSDTGWHVQTRLDSASCLPDRKAPASDAIVAANSACETGRARLFLRALRSGKPQAAPAGQGRSLLPREQRQIRVRSRVPARGQDTTAELRLQNPGRNDEALDFAGAFVDFGDAGVAVVAFDGIFAAVAVAAVDLDGFVRDARGHFAGEKFGDGGVHAEASAGILLPRCFSNEQARSVNFRGHVREHELNSLKLRNGMAKSHALLGILQRRFERALRDARGLSGVADAVRNRDYAIGED